MQHVLVFAYGFPPLNGSGVQRTLKFVKYLPEHGWLPVVVTVLHGQDSGYDEKLLAEVPPAVPVYRVPDCRPGEARAKLKAKWGMGHAGGGNAESASSDNGCGRKVARGSHPLDPVRQMVRVIDNPPPDLLLYWSFRTVPSCVRAAKRHRCSVIYVSGSPFSSFVAGVLAARLSGLPLVLDFRDLWMGGPSDYAPFGWYRRANLALERFCVQKATGIVGNTEFLCADLARRYGPAVGRKCFFIPSGFDPENFREDLPGPPSNGPVTLSFVGICPHRFAHGLLRPLQLLAQTSPATLDNLKVRFVGGQLPLPVMDEFQSLLQHPNITVEPRVPHAAAVEVMRTSDVLVLLLDDDPKERFCYPGKVFEYLASGRPILAIVPEGISSALVLRAQAGVWYDSKDTAGICTALRRVAARDPGFWANFNPDGPFIRRFDRRHLASLLASALDLVSKGIIS